MRLFVYSIAIAIIIAALLLSVAGAQSYTPGQPILSNNQGEPTTDALFWDANQSQGADLCGKIYAAWQAAQKSGVVSAVIDARGLTGPQVCNGNPFLEN